MRGEDHALLIDGRDALAHLAEHLPVFFRGGVADGVGHIDGGCTSFDGDADHFDQIVAVGAGCVFGRELDVVGKGASQADRFAGQIKGFLAADLELVFKVQIA